MRLRGIRIGSGRQQAEAVTAASGGSAPAAVAVDPADERGHTRSFTLPQMPAAGELDGEHVTVYRAGQPHPKVGSDRLHWRELLRGLVRHPTRTFAQMRAHQVWGPALTVSALYGLLATFAFGSTSDQILSSTFGIALTIVLSSVVGFVLAGLMLGSVTQALARRLGGDGAYAPTVGLSMLIAWLTDAPRLLLALFVAPGNGVVQALGWATWALCAWLLTAMLRQVHDLPWGKAATAGALQLIMLLVVIKLPTLG
ncbi:hypothetical protein ABIA32_000014 [Streptacidiphilus sp. MAP12-20]|uniref:Yip1 family protein n=1 Tax=Streptacidiphilus sp. MAP12-20 TaxID=3156299 RepID=UPI0035198E16